MNTPNTTQNPGLVNKPLDLTGVITALQSIAQQIGFNNETFNTIFPVASSSVSTTATAGTATLPASPTGFLAVTIGGTQYKVPLYKP